ncbi:MAG TPA: formyltransferase family protein, partial [Promineifilum sp.]|nr:formyltransferase family protein [Promineifilum sp.]
MSTGEPLSGGLRVLFFGLPAGISAAALEKLLAFGVDVVAVVVGARTVPHLLPATDAPWTRLSPHVPLGLPIVNLAGAADTLSVAWAAGLPVMAVRDFNHPETLTTIAGLAADVAVVSCFTQRLPAALLSVPRHSFLNIHPSLLPAYRGPVPVFWQLRDGAETGVTVHYMDEGLDTGDIAAQAAVPLPDDISQADAERQLMLVGTGLLRDVLVDLARGVVDRQPQLAGGSYFGYPQPADFALSVDWPARRAYNFMRATAGDDVGYP